MSDHRIKIAAAAVVLGLGGLGGYALSSQPGPEASTAVTEKPKTQVVRRTVHVKPKAAPAASAGGGSYSPSAATSSSGAGSYSPAPVSTGSSGGGGSNGGEYEEENEYEGGDD